MKKRSTEVGSTKKRGPGRPVLDVNLALPAKIALRASLEDKEQLDAVMSGFAPGSGVKESSVARAALRLGLSLLEEESHLFADAMFGDREARRAMMREMLTQRRADGTVGLHGAKSRSSK